MMKSNSYASCCITVENYICECMQFMRFVIWIIPKVSGRKKCVIKKKNRCSMQHVMLWCTAFVDRMTCSITAHLPPPASVICTMFQPLCLHMPLLGQSLQSSVLCKKVTLSNNEIIQFFPCSVHSHVYCFFIVKIHIQCACSLLCSHTQRPRNGDRSFRISREAGPLWSSLWERCMWSWICG